MENNKTIPTSLEEMTTKQKRLIEECRLSIYNKLPIDLRRQIKHLNIKYDFSFSIESNVASNGGDIMYYHTYNYKIEFKHSRVKSPQPCIAYFKIVATPSDDDYLKNEITHIKQHSPSCTIGRYFGRITRQALFEISKWMQQGQGNKDMTAAVKRCTRKIVEASNI